MHIAFLHVGSHQVALQSPSHHGWRPQHHSCRLASATESKQPMTNRVNLHDYANICRLCMAATLYLPGSARICQGAPKIGHEYCLLMTNTRLRGGSQGLETQPAGLFIGPWERHRHRVGHIWQQRQHDASEDVRGQLQSHSRQKHGAKPCRIAMATKKCCPVNVTSEGFLANRAQLVATLSHCGTFSN